MKTKELKKKAKRVLFPSIPLKSFFIQGGSIFVKLQNIKSDGWSDGNIVVTEPYGAFIGFLKGEESDRAVCNKYGCSYAFSKYTEVTPITIEEISYMIDK